MAMAATTVDNPRSHALVRRIEELELEPGRLEAVALGLVDALIAGDDEALATALDALRDARGRADDAPELAGWLDCAIAFAHWGLERVPGEEGAVAGGTRAHDFLSVLGDSPQLGSTELRRLLETDETQVSRTGRRLLESGLVTRRKVGRQVYWQLSPRGRQALDTPRPAAKKSANADFWRDALRRGFEGAAGDEPGERRQVDPTRERIVEGTLKLHSAQGIRATTWPQIADVAGVPMETVKALFPTLDDLTRSCGEHLMESLRLPPGDRAAEIFAGASSETDRIRRLVETTFGVYERGADGIAAGRRERTEVAAAAEAMAEADNSFDALVAEAIRPRGAGSSSVASVRALTDLEVWRALRDQGATPEAAVEQASAAVERWLAGQPELAQPRG
jgi:AcrR family transcriptional regulator